MNLTFDEGKLFYDLYAAPLSFVNQKLNVSSGQFSDSAEYTSTPPEFEPEDLGSFQFGYVQGDVDYRVIERGDKPAVEFSFEGVDGADGTPCSGRGWMTVDGEALSGMFFFHRGDESEIELSRMPEQKVRPTKRKVTVHRPGTGAGDWLILRDASARKMCLSPSRPRGTVPFSRTSPRKPGQSP